MIQDIFKSKIAIFFLLIVVCIPVVLPYFNPGYFPTHDGEWAVVRLADMFRTLRDLQFPPRFSGALNFGYGYPLFNFAYPFPYYLGILLYIPLHSFILSIKMVFALSVFLSALFMYLASYKMWNNRLGAITSVLVYIYLPYRMVDLYVRGSIGESLSLAIFPLIFYFGLKLFDNAFSRFTVIILSVSIGILILTHNIMTVLFLPLFFTFFLARIIHEKRFDVMQSFFLSVLLGIGTSAFFWVPAIFEKGNILLSAIPIADRNLYFVTFEKLIFPNWGYGTPTEPNGFTYQLGISQIVIILLSFLIVINSIIKTRFKLTPAKKSSLILISIYFVYFVMTFSVTSIIWKIVPLLSEINYPWTLLSQLGFISAILAGFLVSQGKLFKYIALLSIVVSIILVVPYAKPSGYSNNSDSYYMTNEATTTSSSELMPIWVKDHPKSHYISKVEVRQGDATINDLKFDSKTLTFKYSSSVDSIFKINTIFYPGWKAYVNGDLVDINYNNSQGVMEVNGSKFRNQVSLYFSETPLRVIANIVSVVSILVLLFIFMRPILLFKSRR